MLKPYLDVGDPDPVSNEKSPETRFVPIDGRWSFEGTKAIYEGPAPYERSGAKPGPEGLCLAATRFSSGDLSVTAEIVDQASAARLVFGFNASTGEYYSLGLNGWYYAYVLARSSRTSSQPVRAEGPSSMLTAGIKSLKITVKGQRVSLFVDSICVLQHILPSPFEGDQVGLCVWGDKRVSFENLVVNGAMPKCFVIMQFGKPYDTYWEEVIKPIARKAGFEPIRADDIYGPGVILQDIIRQILDSDVIIAEVTPANPNVFYELGYAHALGKRTILLANGNSEKLPFDISGYRVAYYSDSIGGKRDIESALLKHLNSIQLGQKAG